ncbi:MAG: hypothetical protein KIH08_04820 [Candidatus Freyarchaeota archaeon]|nr:hypothetical protein [Candidatus Jordarchaeia archaeon]MBS7268918.1 hypothetical protein [Candidatus Jordarchaeia archaeon]MBS7279622.1 hypothetical protein [Candidatus Jordarchaeia archaeon]
MNINKSLLTYSVVFLTVEALGLVGTFFVSWQSVYYFYSNGLIYENVYGIYTTFQYFSYSSEALPPLLTYWLLIRAIAHPTLWIMIPAYVVLKGILLILKRFNLARISILMPLLFLTEKFFATLNISEAQLGLLWLSNIFVYPQQGLGGIALLLILFLGIYGVNFFENALVFPIIRKIAKLLKEKPELEISEIAKESGFGSKQLYNNLSKVIYEGVILAVLTPKELVAYDSPKAQELIVEAFMKTLQKNERININDLRLVMRYSKTWFPPQREAILDILKKAQEEGRLQAFIIDKEIVKQPETGLVY